MSLRELFGSVATLPAAEVKKGMEKGKTGDVVLLDVREPMEYAGGHLPGAVHIPLSQLAGRLDELDPSRPVVTY